MSDASLMPLTASMARRRIRGGAVRSTVYAALLLFAIAWTLALGKDVHWDAVNYHLYLGYAALNDRFAQDFFGAGTPSYLNPYAYVPLWLMARAGMDAVWMAVALASLHAAVLWLTFEIALAAGPRDEARPGTPAFAIAAAILAALNPIVLQWLGATAIDLSVGVLVLGGWLALVRALRDGSWIALAVAGVLCGVATALKLSNAVFAIAAVPALAFHPGSVWQRVRAAALFSAACGVAFLAVAWPWSSQLWREFGNPLFPFFNQWFASPDFTAEPLRYERFGAASWRDYVTRPFEMVAPRPLVHTEPRAPELRYVALALAIAAALALRVRDRLHPVAREKTSDAGADRAFAGLMTGLVVAWTFWLSTSGNSRYFVPMACIAGVVLCLVVQRLHRRVGDLALVGLFVVGVAQCVQIALGSDWKRDGQPWQGSWIEADVSPRFRDDPQLYLSAAFLSGSALAPYVHPRSGFINVTGFYAMGPGHPGGARAQRLIERYGERVRLLTPLPDKLTDAAAIRRFADAHAGHFRRFGLRIDSTDCEVLALKGNLRGALRAEGDPPRGSWIRFATCRLVAAPELAAAYAREVGPIDAIFDRIEDACPHLFHPRRPVTQEYPFWARLYNMGSEMQLWIDGGRIRYYSPIAKGDPVDVGSVEQWTAGTPPLDCRRSAGAAR